MNKSDLISIVASNTGLSRKDSEAALKAALELISKALIEGETIRLMGFGTFETKARAARIGRNPKTKEAVRIPASKVPVFKPSTALKNAVGNTAS